MAGEVADKIPERKGLRFEVQQKREYGIPVFDEYDKNYRDYWEWTLIGKDGPVCKSARDFYTEADARSDIAQARGRLKAAKFAKVITI